MPAVASVEFKAVNATQVEGAFKSIGGSAQAASGQIKQASTATEGLGKGMKGSVASIGQVATAFATLSLSIVNVYRSYRDLNDAQLQVDKTTKKLHATELAIKNLKADIAKDQASQKKGGLDYQIQQAKIDKMQQDYNKHQKDGKHTTADLRVEYLAIQKAIKDGSGATGELTAKEEKLKVLEEGLANTKTQLGENQERFNDIQQNFYLSIAPVAISTIATLTTAFGGLKDSIGGAGAGGLIGSLGGLGLVLGGLSLGVIAYQNNWLGLKDAIGGVITWVKDRIGLWKQGFEDVFNLIKKGDWSGVFERIKLGALKFWQDLIKTVPFFGGVAKLVDALAHGQWGVAFEMIKQAAITFWNDLKAKVPLLGKIEGIVRSISEGKWSEAFQKIADAAKEVFTATLGKGIEFIFGKDWINKLNSAVALFFAEANLKGGGLKGFVLQVGVTLNAVIKSVTGIDIAQWFKDHPITAATLSLPLGGITVAADDPAFRGAIARGSLIIINALGAALGRVAGLLDPYLSQVVKALNWNTAITSASDAIVNAGKAIWIWIFGGIKDGFKGQDWGQLFQDLGTTVNDWWKKNAPDTQKAIVENFKQSPLGKITIPFIVKPEVSKDAPTIIQNGINKTGQRGQYTVPIHTDTSKMPAELKTQLTGVINRQHPIVKIDANLAAANAKWQAFARKVQMTTLHVKIAGTGVNIRTGSQAGAYGGPHAGGYSGIVRQPTLMQVGEGGREERVSVTPIGSTGHSGDSSGGGGTEIFNIYLDGEKIDSFTRNRTNKFQGVMK